MLKSDLLSFVFCIKHMGTVCWSYVSAQKNISKFVSAVSSQGIQFLIENDLLKNTCEDIAQFLYKGEGLNKTAIGDYLGERWE